MIKFLKVRFLSLSRKINRLTARVGVFENYLRAKSMNDEWNRILEAHDWLYLYDRLDGKLHADRDYELLAYMPFTFVPWYKLFSSHTAKPVEFPKADFEVSFIRLL